MYKIFLDGGPLHGTRTTIYRRDETLEFDAKVDGKSVKHVYKKKDRRWDFVQGGDHGRGADSMLHEYRFDKTKKA